MRSKRKLDVGQSLAVNDAGGKPELGPADPREIEGMTGGFRAWVSRVWRGDRGTANLTSVELDKLQKEKEIKALMIRSRKQLESLRKDAEESAVKGGFAGSFAAEANLIEVCYEPYKDILDYAKRNFSKDMKFWKGMTAYLESLSGRSEEGHLIFSDNVRIHKIIDSLGNEPELVLALLMDIFNNQGRIARHILGAGKLLSVDLLRHKEKIRARLIVYLLGMGTAELVESFLDYYWSLPAQYIDSELRMEALKDFCQLHPVGGNELSDDDIQRAKDFIATREKRGGTPYR